VTALRALSIEARDDHKPSTASVWLVIAPLRFDRWTPAEGRLHRRAERPSFVSVTSFLLWNRCLQDLAHSLPEQQRCRGCERQREM